MKETMPSLFFKKWMMMMREKKEMKCWVYSIRDINKSNKNVLFHVLKSFDKEAIGGDKLKKPVSVVFYLLLPVGCIKIRSWYGSKNHDLLSGLIFFGKGW